MSRPFTIAYYGNGDLYIRSMRYRKGEAWLPKGGSSIEQFNVRKHGYYDWDGRYLVINGELRGKREILTRYSLNGASGTVEGKVTLTEFHPERLLSNRSLCDTWIKARNRLR